LTELPAVLVEHSKACQRGCGLFVIGPEADLRNLQRPEDRFVRFGETAERAQCEREDTVIADIDRCGCFV
jgi:hypothetical protein